ncbi:MAG: hypothetical protein JXJ17_05720 [Anaerolineae bacterium]|nr:hypothetical protein [Anaerolineae bacterium]
MFKHWTDNPIYARLKKADKPCVKPAMWITGIIGLAGLIYSIWLLITISGLGNTSSAITSIIRSILSTITWLLILVIPLIVAITGITLTGKDINSESYQLVRMTGLSNKTLIRGYALAACHRQRVLIALVAALSPTSALLNLLIEDWPVALWLAIPAVLFETIQNLALIVIITFAATGLALKLKRPAVSIGIVLGIRLLFGLIIALTLTMASFLLAFLMTWRAAGNYDALSRQSDIFMLMVVPCTNVLLALILAGIALWLMRDNQAGSSTQQGSDHVQPLER